MTDQELLDGLKSALNYPKEVTTFDSTLLNYARGAKSYVDGILDNYKNAQSDPLYKLCVINWALYLYQNRGITNTKTIPIGMNALLNKLKSKYLN